MPRKILCFAFTLLLFLCAALVALPPARASIAHTDETATADYWARRTENAATVLLTPEELRARNAQLIASEPTLHDLSAESTTLDGETVKSLIWSSTQEYWPQDAFPTLYTTAGQLPWRDWNAALTNRNIAGVPARVTVRYAVTTRRADLRLLPVAQGFYEDMSEISRHYDSLQATALDPGAPLLVYQTSGDGRFAFVEAQDYRGWLDVSSFAYAPRETWEKFAAPNDFYVVTTAKLHLTPSGETDSQVYQMGARLPCETQNGETRLLLPTRDTDGQLNVSVLPLTENLIRKQTATQNGAAAPALSHGYLPLTRENIIRQAFQFLGSIYGWGGQDESVDCSSFVQDAYRSMGVTLPRDADRQEAALENIPLSGLSRAARYAAVKAAPAGSLLFKPGHVMLYLGTDDAGTPLAIHAASSYYAGGQKIYLRRVIVSDLTYQNGSGTATIDGMTSIGLLP